MTEWWEGVDYYALREVVRQKLTNIEMPMGWDYFEKHDTPERKVGTPCVACREPWPCENFLMLSAYHH